jgi:electron transfer flavoprotein beta subunit
MKVLVCIKRVPAPGARINITPDGQAVDTAFLGFTMSPHEECAVEEAVQLVEKHGGDATVLTLGPAEADEQLRYAASLGVAKAVLLPIDGPDWDPQRTAAAIAAAIRDVEAAEGRFDLILFGNESADSGNFQIGIRVAHALDRPVVNGIKGIDVHDDVIRARREADAGVEVYEVPLPAVLGVKEGINLPRYPTLKGRLASKKVEVANVAPQGDPGGQQMVTLLPAAEQVSATVVLGNGPDAAAAVVDMLTEIGVFK